MKSGMGGWLGIRFTSEQWFCLVEEFEAGKNCQGTDAGILKSKPTQSTPVVLWFYPFLLPYFAYRISNAFSPPSNISRTCLVTGDSRVAKKPCSIISPILPFPS